MSAQLTCRVESEGGIVAIRPEGLFDLAGATSVRAVLLKALAEAPVGIIVDLAAMAVVDDILLTLFSTMAGKAVIAEPSTALVLHSPTPAVAASLTALGIDRRVSGICVSHDDAVRRARLRTPGDFMVWHLPALPDSVVRARALTAATCEQWEVPDAASDRLQVIVTELVTNVIRHARTPMDLVLRRSERYVHVNVLDGDESNLARLLGPETPVSPGGRGLMLVEAFATAWGSHVTGRGKSTWATVRYRSLPG